MFADVGKKSMWNNKNDIKSMPIDFVSVKEYASRNGLSERTVRNYCAVGRMKELYS